MFDATTALRRFINFYKGFTWLRWVLPGFTGFYRVLLGFTGFHWVLLFYCFFWFLPGFTGFYWVLLGFTGFYWVLMGLFKLLGNRVLSWASGYRVSWLLFGFAIVAT